MFKLRFIGEFVDQNKDETSMHVYSFTRLRAGAPSRREPEERGQELLVG